LLANLERNYIPAEGPRWRRWTVGVLAWSIAGPLLLLAAVAALGLAAVVALGVLFLVLSPTINQLDAFTALWAVAVVLAGVGAWLWFWADQEDAAFAVGALVAVVALVAIAGRAWSRPPTGFCAKHDCISNFSDGKGSIVQCADGM
jgi:hypothetical protein